MRWGLTMQPDRAVRALIVVLVLMGWASSSLALVAAPQLLSDIPPLEIALSGMIAMWGAAARTAQRTVNQRRDPQFSLGLELVRDLVVSSLLGLLVWSYGTSSGWDGLRMAIALGVAGYGGSAVLDVALTRLKGGVSAP